MVHAPIRLPHGQRCKRAGSIYPIPPTLPTAAPLRPPCRCCSAGCRCNRPYPCRRCAPLAAAPAWRINACTPPPSSIPAAPKPARSGNRPARAPRHPAQTYPRWQSCPAPNPSAHTAPLPRVTPLPHAQSASPAPAAPSPCPYRRHPRPASAHPTAPHCPAHPAGGCAATGRRGNHPARSASASPPPWLKSRAGKTSCAASNPYSAPIHAAISPPPSAQNPATAILRPPPTPPPYPGGFLFPGFSRTAPGLTPTSC